MKLIKLGMTSLLALGTIMLGSCGNKNEVKDDSIIDDSLVDDSVVTTVTMEEWNQAFSSLDGIDYTYNGSYKLEQGNEDIKIIKKGNLTYLYIKFTTGTFEDSEVVYFEYTNGEYYKYSEKDEAWTRETIDSTVYNTNIKGYLNRLPRVTDLPQYDDDKKAYVFSDSDTEYEYKFENKKIASITLKQIGGVGRIVMTYTYTADNITLPKIK